jgi:hypothetical protein
MSKNMRTKRILDAICPSLYVPRAPQTAQKYSEHHQWQTHNTKSYAHTPLDTRF